MEILALFDSWAELRDVLVIMAGIAASLVALVILLVIFKLSLVAYRVVRRLERFHERRLVGSVAAADAQLGAWLEQDRWSAEGMLELLRIAASKIARKVEARRNPPAPPKRSLFGLLPPR